MLMFCGLLFLIMKLCEPMVIFMPHGMLINKFTICHLSLDFLYCSANHAARKQLACNYCLFVDTIIIMRCRAGKKKLKSSGPVHFSLQLPPLKYYLPNRCTMFMPYQLTRLLRLISLAHRTTKLPFSLAQEQNLFALGNLT